MNGNSRQGRWPAIDLAHEPDFRLGPLSVRPSASELTIDGEVRRLEPRVMQVLVALVQASGAVISRDELMARCWTGLAVSEDAITRAVGQVRRLAPGAFTVETIPKIGYRLIPVAAPAATPQRRGFAKAMIVTAIVLMLIAGFTLLNLPQGPAGTAELGTQNVDANDRYLRATALLDAGGEDNALRAEQLLREALALDPEFHAAKEALAIALLAVAAFVPERAGAAHAESAALVGNEVAETPVEWRSHLMRGFQLATQGAWLATEQALMEARSAAPASEQPNIIGLQIFLHGNVGRFSEALALMKEQALVQPLSLDTSRVLQQWLDRTGDRAAAEAEYVRSRDIPGDRSPMEMAALIRALGSGDEAIIEERFVRYRETDWGRAGDDALYDVRSDSAAALASLRHQVENYTDPGAMPPFLAAAWAVHYGDVELAVKGLRAAPASLFQTAGLLWDPVFADARRTAAFKQLLRDFGYVEYWRVTGNWGDFCRPLGDDDFECN